MTARGDDTIVLTFVGTHGEIDVSSRLHRRHSAMLVRHGRTRLMIDCGLDWLGRFGRYRPTAILITHAHPDHAWGLSKGADCPVFATAVTRRILSRYPVRQWKTVAARRPFRLGGLTIEAFPVEHSILAPAVGYRIACGRNAFFYIPDVVYIRDRAKALKNVQVYIGDGASISRPLVRRRGNTLFGHAAISTQLGWCAKEGVARAVFTHCGTEIVAGDARKIEARIDRLGQERGVEARIARDGMRLTLRNGTIRLPRR